MQIVPGCHPDATALAEGAPVGGASRLHALFADWNGHVHFCAAIMMPMSALCMCVAYCSVGVYLQVSSAFYWPCMILFSNICGDWCCAGRCDLMC